MLERFRLSFRGRRARREGDAWLQARAPRQPAPAWRVAAWLALLAALVLLPWLFYHFHFRRNPQYVLRDLTIVSGTTMNEMLVREMLGLREGMPLFDTDIEQRRLDLLGDAPNVRSILITRRLPSRMDVRIVEREPVARVGRSGHVVDADGVIFPRYVGVGHLPVLAGLEGINVQPGSRLTDLGVAAVRFLNLIGRPEYGLPVGVVDISRGDYLLVILSDQRQIKLSWKGMGRTGGDAEEALRRRLTRLLQAMSRLPNQRVYDATLPEDDRMFAMP
jgi:hypothetical protein